MFDPGTIGRLLLLDLQITGAELMIGIIKLEYKISSYVRNAVINTALRTLTLIENVLS